MEKILEILYILSPFMMRVVYIGIVSLLYNIDELSGKIEKIQKQLELQIKEK